MIRMHCERCSARIILFPMEDRGRSVRVNAAEDRVRGNICVHRGVAAVRGELERDGHVTDGCAMYSVHDCQSQGALPLGVA